MSSRAFKPLCLLLLAMPTAVNAAEMFDTYRCELPGYSAPIYFSPESDGKPARIGIKPGLGDKATVYRNSGKGIEVWVKFDPVDGVPTTMTTINTELRALHSLHFYLLDDEFIHEQGIGQCEISQ